MARVSEFIFNELQRNSVHDEVEATYSVFESNGERFLQIDTYGRKDRQIPGKRSQSFQLDKEAAMNLVKLLSSEFDL